MQNAHFAKRSAPGRQECCNTGLTTKVLQACFVFDLWGTDQHPIADSKALASGVETEIIISDKAQIIKVNKHWDYPNRLSCSLNYGWIMWRSKVPQTMKTIPKS